jgi:ferredoxin, 2Fe-2S
MVRLVFVDSVGVTHEVEAEVGESVMKVAVRNNIRDIEGECGGEMNCATCHVQPRPGWHLPEPSLDETDMLDIVNHRNELSRLGCQIRLDESLDGLILDVPPAD